MLARGGGGGGMGWGGVGWGGGGAGDIYAYNTAERVGPAAVASRLFRRPQHMPSRPRPCHYEYPHSHVLHRDRIVDAFGWKL